MEAAKPMFNLIHYRGLVIVTPDAVKELKEADEDKEAVQPNTAEPISKADDESKSTSKLM